MPLNPCARLAKPAMGSAASAAGVMSTRAAPARNDPAGDGRATMTHSPHRNRTRIILISVLLA
jgi:hypothetical protein